MLYDAQFSISASAQVRAENQLFWVCNPHACKLLGMLRSYFGAQTILPVSHLKRSGFTRRAWELATKGTRKRDGRKLVDAAPAPDGLEYYGIVNEVTITDAVEVNGVKSVQRKTFWVLGEVTEAAVQECSEQFHEALERAAKAKKPVSEVSDIIDASVDEADASNAQKPPRSADESVNEVDDAFDAGCAYQHPISYEKGRDDTLTAIAGFVLKDPAAGIAGLLDAVGAGCVKSASIIEDIKGASLTPPAYRCSECGGGVSAAELEAQQRAESEAELGF